MIQQCYLNGDILPLSEARVSPLDRGFLFGDGVYEVVPVYARQPFYWRRHIARLRRSLAQIGLPFDAESIEEPMRRLLAAHPAAEQALYIQITRGVAEPRRHKPPPDASPTVFMFTVDRPPVAADKLQNGVSGVTADDFRWRRGDIKSVSLLGAVLLAAQADAAGADETLLLRDGNLTEGYSCNIVVVRDRALLTPPNSGDILSGVTCQVVLEVAAGCGYEVRRENIRADSLSAADEIWLTSSVREMLPVTRLDGVAVGGGAPGSVFKAVYAAWRAHVGGG